MERPKSRERDDDAERDDGGLPGEPVPLGPGPARRHAEEDGHDAGRVGDHDQRDERFPEELDVG